MGNFKLIGYDDVQLNLNRYLIENHKGMIICVHGMCEHSLRYEELALYLNKNHYSVYTYDHRGHGDSILADCELGYQGIDGFNKMVYDLDVVVSYVKEKHTGDKVFILGHSMGSFVVQRYMQKYNKVDGVILSGSNFGQKLLGVGISLSKIACIIKGEKNEGKLLEKLSFGNFNKSFSPSQTTHDWLNDDHNAVIEYIDDPKCGFTCSNRFYLDFFKGLRELSKPKNIALVDSNLPVFIIAGDKDPVGNMGEGIKKLYDTYQKYLRNVKMKLYKNYRHEILKGNKNKVVFNDIVNWLNKISK